VADDAPVTVVGLLGGRPVGDAATAALASAALVAGGRVQLAAVADLLPPDARTVVVGAGLGALDHVGADPGPAVVLASGDPGFFGIVRALAARLGGTDRLVVHPAPSSVSLAFARLGLPWDTAVVRSCHTGDAVRVAAEVARAEVAAVLTGPDAPPEAVGAALVALGAHHRLVVVATRLGEPGEALVRCTDLADLAAGRFDHRSVVVLAHPSPPAKAAALGGRPVADFAHRASMITKPEVRSVVLGKLDLPAAGVVWDVGAGSGSVAIEAALAAPGLRVIAVERNHDDAERVHANAAALGASVDVVEGAAPAVLHRLPPPDRVFVGGGGLAVLDACFAALRPGGRLVATFAAVDRAAAAHRLLGNLVLVGVDRAEVLPDGGIRLAADNPVFVAWGDAPAAAVGDHHRRVVVGVGCSSTAVADEVSAVVADALAAAGETAADAFATIDVRAGHPALPSATITFPSSLLGVVDVPNPSAAVDIAVGTPSVAEAAALLAAGPGGRLVVPKGKGATATAAVAVGRVGPGSGSVDIVGLGPGGAAHRTPAATAAVRQADAVIGYGPYVDAVGPLLRPGQLVFRGTMGAEAERAGAALDLARCGWRVALVSSGDAGVFAMAARTIERAAAGDVAVRMIPGVTAAHAAAAVAGTPLGRAHALVTLSDRHLSWATIEDQLRAAASSGMALALYNPRSAGRPGNLARARDVLAEVLDPSTPVVVVTDATGPDQSVVHTTLSALDPEIVGMRSMVLVAGR
jgi:precorrin-3B C17-methyltransferase/precorrin-6y C5,15-methyltransferase (decarboxylating) CbiE subunit/precorrin-6Y C5,15-methyltransferase (decarboxylating) CbiT subunit